jgi:hypothetical protein
MSPHRTKRLVATTLAVIAALYWVVAIPQIEVGHSVDFAVYYVAVKALALGRNPYNPTDFKRTEKDLAGVPAIEADRSVEPPFFLLCMKPLATVNYKVAWSAWIILTAIFFALALFFLLMRHHQHWANTITVAALALLYHPVVTNLQYGQSKILLLLLLTLTLLAYESGKERIAGLSLAIASLARLFPGLLLIHFAMLRRWQLIAFALAGGTIGTAIAMIVLGFRTCISFVASVAYHLNSRIWRDNFADIAPKAVTAKLLTSVVVPAAVKSCAVWIPGLLALVLTSKLALRRTSDPAVEPALFSLWLVTALIVLPVIWPNDLVILLIPFADIANAFFEAEVHGAILFLAAVSYLLPTVEWLVRHVSLYSNLPVRVPAIYYGAIERIQVLGLIAAYAAVWLFVRSGKVPKDRTPPRR